MSNKKTLELTVFNYCVSLLAQSSRDLAARFGQQRTVNGQIALVREELAEVLAATDDAHRVEELCDLVVVTCGLADAANTPIFNLRDGNFAWTDYSTKYPDEWFKMKVEYALQWPSGSFAIFTLLETIYIRLGSIPNAAELFPAAVAAVVAKNAAKSDATHYLDAVTGKITRRGQPLV